jgi:lipopolysaccharide/colanic/teichoic acid biosynthesis glycosyltransferase
MPRDPSDESNEDLAGHRPARPLTALSRIIDLVVAGSAIVVLAPVMIVTAVLVRTTSPGPALFRQPRVGYRQRSFVMLKFRSMYADAGDEVHRDFVSRMLSGTDARPAQAGTLFKLSDDNRVTPVGRILRVTSLDELPQLFNVLRGDMALVGPRPALPWEVPLFEPHHHRRFEVKPGMTGLWQVSGRSRLTFKQALELDVEYTRRRSLALDLSILLRTVRVVLDFRSSR